MAGQPMICPHCRSVVVPMVQPDGQRLCPACGNTGVVRAQQPQWGGQPGETAPGAVAALVLGIVSFVPYVGIVTGGIAIYLGASALRAIRANPGRYTGEGMAQAGRILGIVALALYVVTVFLAAIVFVLVSNHGIPDDPAPALMFSSDGRGVGGVLTVTSAESGLRWSDFLVSPETCSVDPGDRTVTAGDRITCTADGGVDVIHLPTNTLVYRAVV